MFLLAQRIIRGSDAEALLYASTRVSVHLLTSLAKEGILMPRDRQW